MGRNALHGGAVAALCAWVGDRHDPGPERFVAKLAIELLRALQSLVVVPVVPWLRDAPG